MKVKMIVFDLYGTLVYIKQKTNPYSAILKTMPREERGEFVKAILCGEISESVGTFRHVNTNDTEKFAIDLFTEIESASLYPDATHVIQKLRRLGYTIGVISNLATPYKEPFYQLGLNEIVHHVIFSCDHGYIKPHSTIYGIMRQISGFDFDEMLMIGDSPKCDVAGPKAVGMHSLPLNRDGNASKKNSIKTLDEILTIL